MAAWIASEENGNTFLAKAKDHKKHRKCSLLLNMALILASSFGFKSLLSDNLIHMEPRIYGNFLLFLLICK